MESKIELKKTNELLGMNFYIPSYQRGYRWTEQQVKDLLNDIDEFKQEGDNWYCLQPLVVKKTILDIDQFKQEIESKTELQEIIVALNRQIRYEVIDGQQRLTTIFIILSYFGATNIFDIEYETRKDSKEFLRNITTQNESLTQVYIDFSYMGKAYETVKTFLEQKDQKQRDNFKNKLKNNVKFIWYEIDEPDPIKVFTRLNIGKIPLTNAELIKALFLNRSNFSKDESVRLCQQEIASEWDNMEYTLQNEEFWLFLNNPGYQKPTRIDFIFDLVCEQNELHINKDNIGTDQYHTFRYFYEYFKTGNADVEFCWKAVKKYFQIFQEWYNNLEIYHYIGYLVICQNDRLVDFINKWNESKTSFLEYLKGQIKTVINSCPDLNFQFKEDGSGKVKCKPILLFHNIQTVINQNLTQRSNEKYQLGVFYKFPFHLYKLESWDVEHINSNTDNVEDDEETQKEWLLNIYMGVNETLQDKIKQYFSLDEIEDKKELFNEIKEEVKSEVSIPEKWTQEEKNKIENYTLLDSSTNRSYGNAIFSGKRRVIIGKDKGKLIPVPKLSKDGKLVLSEEKDAVSSFVPPVTKHVFLKYYSATAGNNNYWTKNDAEAYKKDIKSCLEKLD
ncbi:DUF262 domain-containing protein [Bacteroides sp. An322]|uniref:DUF262 domain-containing protein n=1 Tax=Bacteroides sp. An322 TaxID=1965632 RepID=UPI000B39BEEF|nr:DUF262 domain-containing protein [Bacteroides sp. An322]OUO18052.1 hypothetical protein B5F91_11650 [Bacteroides sp. An322]